MTTNTAPETEFQAAISLEEIGDAPVVLDISAPQKSLASIATRLAVPDVKCLDATFKIQRDGADIRIEGALNALVVRRCVASLQLMEEPVSEDFRLRLVREISDDAPDPLNDDDLEEDVDLAPLHAINLADLSIQQLALAMTPYPRKEDAAGDQQVEETYGDAEEPSPFAVLKGLMDERKN